MENVNQLKLVYASVVVVPRSDTAARIHHIDGRTEMLKAAAIPENTQG